MTSITDRIAGLSPEQRELLARRLIQRRGAAPRPSIPRLDREAQAFPLSFPQQRQWFMEQLMPGAVYNVPQALRLSGPLDPAALERALDALARRHEALRTTFRVVDGQAAQVVAPHEPWSLPWLDLSGLPAPERAAALERATEQQARARFELERGPLWRALLVRLGGAEHVLIVTMHHIIADGWSFGVAMRELAALYGALLQGQTPELPELAVQYVDYAAWQRARLQGPALERDLAYWRRRLAGVPALLELPTDRPRPPAQTFAGATVPVAVPPALTAALRKVGERAGATLFMTVLAAFKALLARYSGQDDICVGSPTASRTHAELEPLIGLFINTLPLRTDLGGDPSFAELLARVRQTALEAFAHQDIPLEKLVEELRIERDLSYSPLFQVLFVQTEASATAVSMPGLEVAPLQLHSGTAQFDLSLYLTEAADELRGFVEYNTDLFDPLTALDLVRHFLELLERIAAQPGARLSELAGPIPPQKLELVVTSAFTAQPLEDSLAFWMAQLGLPARVRFAPYSQVFQQLLDPASLLSRNREGANIILLRLEDWAQQFDGPPAALAALLEQHVGDFLEALALARARTAAPCLICLCPPSETFAAAPGRAALLGRLGQTIARRAAALPGVTLLRDAELLAGYQLQSIHDPRGDELGHIPYTPEFFAVLGTALAEALVAPGVSL